MLLWKVAMGHAPFTPTPIPIFLSGFSGGFFHIPAGISSSAPPAAIFPHRIFHSEGAWSIWESPGASSSISNGGGRLLGAFPLITAIGDARAIYPHPPSTHPFIHSFIEIFQYGFFFLLTFIYLN